MTPANPWIFNASPGTPPVEVARIFAANEFDSIDDHLRRVDRFGGRWDTTGRFHGVFVVEGEDGEFEISGDREGNWSVEAIR